jgi:hypothetical protein
MTSWITHQANQAHLADLRVERNSQRSFLRRHRRNAR